MNKNIVRILTGLGIIAVGIAALMGSLDLINFRALFLDWWPLLVIGAGLLMLIGNPRQFLWPMLIIMAGILLELRQLDIVTFNVWELFWPAAIIAVGLSVLTNQTRSHSGTSKKELDTINAVLSSNQTKNQSKEYKGGDVTSVFGGVELDLRHTTITSEAALNVFILCGGVTIIVPENWVVVTKLTPIAGGVENKTEAKKSASAPTLTISGDIIFGGLDIKR